MGYEKSRYIELLIYLFFNWNRILSCSASVLVGPSYENLDGIDFSEFWIEELHAIWLYKDHGKCFSTSGPYIFPKFQYQWSLCGP